MIPTKQATRKQRKSSRDRNDNRPWGYQATTFTTKSMKRIKKDINAGLLPKSALSTTITIAGRKKKK